MKCPQCQKFELEEYSEDKMICYGCDVLYFKRELNSSSANWRSDLQNEKSALKPMDVKNMPEQKAVPLNVVVSDVGKKAVRIGKAFVNLDSTCPLSVTIDKAALEAALKNGTVSEHKYAGNEKYPDPVLDNKNVIRMAGFKIEKKA